MELTMASEAEKREEQENVQAGLESNHGPMQLHSEIDLSEHDDSSDNIEEEEKHVDYTQFTKKDFSVLVKELSKDNNFKKIDNIVREIKPLFDDIREKEKAAALQRFIGDGGITEDFDYKGDEFDAVFDANLKLIRDRKSNTLNTRKILNSKTFTRKKILLNVFACY